jgi:hypothetical protein
VWFIKTLELQQVMVFLLCPTLHKRLRYTKYNTTVVQNKSISNLKSFTKDIENIKQPGLGLEDLESYN